jgi:hypothetical protein
VVVLRILPEVMAEIANCVVVAFVAVAFPEMVRLELMVLEAEEINPLWKRCRSVVVAAPLMVRPVPVVAPPRVVDAFTMTPMVVVGAR